MSYAETLKSVETPRPTTPTVTVTTAQASPLSPSASSNVPVDIFERKDEYLITVELAGCRTEDIDLCIANGQLHITAERDLDERVSGMNTGGTGDRMMRERSATVKRSIPVPSDADVDHCSSAYSNGLLKITIPKRHTTRTKPTPTPTMATTTQLVSARERDRERAHREPVFIIQSMPGFY